MRYLLLIVIVLLLKINYSISQNIVITDDDTYVANTSAMLDVKSITKGMLVPRLTSSQRNGISSPATGLLVYDTTLGGFYFYNGTSWTNITSGNSNGLWTLNSSKVYLQNTNYRLGVGTTNPIGKMEVKSDAGIGINEPIFHVVNNNGDTVFAVYNQGVRINVLDDPAKASGSKGGFAVGGFSPAKGTFTNEFLRVTPDSVRIYIQDNPAKVSGSKGGFAVGGFSPSKTTATNYLDLTPQNYFIGHESGISNTTGLYNSFMGFNSGKTNKTGSSNTFLGYKSGYLNYSGNGNVSIGPVAGYSNNNGNFNTYLGDSAGYSNQGGWYNVAIGYSAGKSNLANNNTFIGTGAGEANSTGLNNTFIGNSSAFFNKTGNSNTAVGIAAGVNNYTGNYNVLMGSYAGYGGNTYFEITGNHNVFIGANAGYNVYNNTKNTSVGNFSGYNNKFGNNNVFFGFRAGFNETASSKMYIANGATLDSTFLYGDLINKVVYTKQKLSVNSSLNPSYYLEVVDNTVTNDNPAIYGKHNVTDNWGIGIKGDGSYMGVQGVANSTTGYNFGVYGLAQGTGTGTRYGIYGSASGGATAYAGYFQGNVHVNGTLSKSAGSFKIDHPQDPANKFLSHSFVESPDMMNIYNGIAIIEANGNATVELPAYFQSLNKDFKYQLTPIGASMPNLYISQEIANNQFIISGGQAGKKVSWEITGVRKDPYAVQNPIIVEEIKKTDEIGRYLNPELYNQPISKSLNSVEK